MAEITRSQKILGAVLLVSAAYLAWDFYASKEKTGPQVIESGPRPAKTGSEPEDDVATQVATTRSITQRGSKQRKIVKVPHYAQIWGRDPFIGELVEIGTEDFISATVPEDTLVGLEDYQLYGISFRGNEPTVLINKAVLHIGDQIDGLTLEDVSSNSVVLSKGNRKYVLKQKTSLK